MAYDECCTAGAWAAAWQVLTAWRRTLDTAGPTQPGAHGAQPALALLGRMLFVCTHAAALSDAQLPPLCDMMSEAAGACRHAVAAFAPAPQQPASKEAGGPDVCVWRRLQSADAGARIASRFGAAAAAARAWVPAAALLEAAGVMLDAAACAVLARCSCVTCSVDKGLGAGSMQQAAQHGAALQLVRTRCLQGAAAALLSAHDAAPGESSLLQRAKAVLRSIKGEQQAAGDDTQAAPPSTAGAATEATPQAPPPAAAAGAADELLTLNLELLVATHNAAAPAQRRLLNAMAQHPQAAPADMLRAGLACLAPRARLL